MLMKITDNCRVTTPLLGEHRAREPDPAPPACGAREDDSQWNYWYSERPPPEPPLFEVDPVEEAAREKRHIAALMKARPGTTEEYWREVTRQTEVPEENLASWRSPKLIELGRRESIRRSDNFVEAPTAAAAEPCRSVQDPAGMSAGRPEREHYQLQQTASDEERRTDTAEPTQSQAIETSTMLHTANSVATENVEHHHNSTSAVGAHCLDDPDGTGGGIATATPRKLPVEPESGCGADHVVSKGAPLPRHAHQCPPAPREQHGRLRAREEGEAGATWSVQAHHTPATTASLDHRHARGEGRPAGDHPSRVQAKKRTEPSSMTAPQATHQHVTVRRAGHNQRWLDRAESTRSSIEASWTTDATVPTRRLWADGPDRSQHTHVNEAPTSYTSDTPVRSETAAGRRASRGSIPSHGVNARPRYNAETEGRSQEEAHENRHHDYIHYRPPSPDNLPAPRRPDTWSRYANQKGSEGAKRGARLYAEAYQDKHEQPLRQREHPHRRLDRELREAKKFADTHAEDLLEATRRAESMYNRAAVPPTPKRTDPENHNTPPDPKPADPPSQRTPQAPPRYRQTAPATPVPPPTPRHGQDEHGHAKQSWGSQTTLPDERRDSGKVYLFVAYEHIREAKSMGARYDPDRKRWYVPNAEPHLIQRWGSKVWAQERKYIDVPFRDNDEARRMGAKWDREARQWYDPTSDARLMRIWGPAPSRPPRQRDDPETRRYIRVSYHQRHRAKILGARWDPQAKSWYAPASLATRDAQELVRQFSETRKPAQRMMQKILETPPAPRAANPKTHSPTPLSPGDTTREGGHWGMSSVPVMAARHHPDTSWQSVEDRRDRHDPYVHNKANRFGSSEPPSSPSTHSGAVSANAKGPPLKASWNRVAIAHDTSVRRQHFEASATHAVPHGYRGHPGFHEEPPGCAVLTSTDRKEVSSDLAQATPRIRKSSV